MSGGERQRLALARGLYDAPQMLILDEATGALDPHTEDRVLQNLARIRDELLLLIVTHRERPLSACDRVYTIESNTLSELSVSKGAWPS